MAEHALNLTDSLGQAVVDADGESLGRLADLAVTLDDPYPPVTRIVVREGRGSYEDIPWSTVESFGRAQVALARAERLPAAAVQSNEILLAKEVLDCQIFDLAGKRLARVGDVELALEDGELRAVGVEVGAASILRRLGLRGFARRAGTRALDWRSLHLVPPRVHQIQLETAAAAVHRLDAAELADLVAHLPPAHGETLLGAVHPEKAAGARELLRERPRRARRFNLVRTRRRAPP